MAAEILKIKNGPSLSWIEKLLKKGKDPEIEFTVEYRGREIKLPIVLHGMNNYFNLKSDIRILNVGVLLKELIDAGVSLEDKDISHAHQGVGMLGKYHADQNRGYFVFE